MPQSLVASSTYPTPEKWQQILSDLVTDPKELLKILQLQPSAAGVDPGILQQFPLRVPRPYIDRIQKGNWQDPLLRQILPVAEEESGLIQATGQQPDFDPLREADYNPLPGLLHKYPGRVLLTVAPHCAIHCRYCFRRHFDYQANTPGRSVWQQVFAHIREDNSISEVIFSGGDPLAAPDRQLAWLISQLESIPHVKRLRIHTRLPIVVPQRITPELLECLRSTKLHTVVVLHCNHSQELALDVFDAISTLAAEGITLLNQSVLLKGVNDNLSTLRDLSEMLFALRVLPYYLHLLDRVPGVLHFDVPENRAQELIRQMRAMLPGYLVPRLVREQPGASNKTVVA